MAEVAWAVLRTRVRQILEQPPDTSSKNAPVLPESLAELFEAPSSSLSIPASVLAVAPHLAKLSANIKADAHLEETQHLRSLYAPDKVQDVIVANAQLASTSDPIPRSIWHQVTLDQFVDFEKLFASMDKGYEHLDDIKDFGVGFALVKKEQSHKKHPIRDESEWLQVFSAWRSAVGHLYPHWIQELEKFLEIVTDVFRAAPGEPHRAIQFDLEVRDRYSRRPFRMDDRSQLNLPLLAQLFQTANSRSSLQGTKRTDHASSTPATKRADTPCRKWSFGTCTTDPCPNKWKHGICFICGEPHRAKDNPACASSKH